MTEPTVSAGPVARMHPDDLKLAGGHTPPRRLCCRLLAGDGRRTQHAPARGPPEPRRTNAPRRAEARRGAPPPEAAVLPAARGRRPPHPARAVLGLARAPV